MAKLSITNLNLGGRRVFIRVDFNVPIKEGRITDDTRDPGVAPTIQYALDHGATVILASHLGRPKGKVAPDQPQARGGAPRGACSRGTWSSPNDASASPPFRPLRAPGRRGASCCSKRALPQGGDRTTAAFAAGMGGTADLY